MMIPEHILKAVTHTLHLKPVMDKNGIFFKVKRDGRMKRQVYHLKLHVDGGYIEGDFLFDGWVTDLLEVSDGGHDEKNKA